MRKAEIALYSGARFGGAHLSRANLAWRIGGRFIISPTAEDLAGLAEGDYALLTFAPSKADQFGLIWTSAPAYLPWHADAPISAARELATLELAHPAGGEARRAIPLFVDGAGAALRHAPTDKRFADMLAAIGVPEVRRKCYSMHSWRSYLACALLAANCSHAQIMSMLRWRSEDSLRVYARLNDTTYATWLDAAGTAAVSSVQSGNIAAHTGGAEASEAAAEAAGAVQFGAHVAGTQTAWLTQAAAAQVDERLLVSGPTLDDDADMGALQAAVEDRSLLLLAERLDAALTLED